MFRREYANRRFTSQQSATDIRIGKFVLSAPSNHILFRLQPVQPHRDLAVGILAGELQRKYPGQPLVDVGANIGDTAAIMATYSESPLVLIEPSEFYGRFLRNNVERLPNRTTIHPVMISANTREQGVLMHTGGTARFEAVSGGENWIDCKRLADLTDERPCLIKIDTDGFDLPILEGSLDYLEQAKPCLFYENEVSDEKSREAANRAISSLRKIGYHYFAVFDDSGLHLVSTTEPDILYGLNEYLHKVRTAPAERDLYNYDVLCATQMDADVFAGVTEYYRKY